MTLLKMKIALINVMLMLITITVLAMVFYLVISDEHQTPIAISLVALISSLIAGFFYELKLLHNKDMKGDKNEKLNKKDNSDS